MGRRREGSLLSLEVRILEALAEDSSIEGLHGFALARTMADRDAGPLTAHGTLYKALARLADTGLVAATWEDPEVAAGEGRPRRRYYRMTAVGSAALAASRVTAPVTVARLREATS